MENNNNKVILIVIGLIVIVGIGFFILKSSDKEVVVDNQTNTEVQPQQNGTTSTNNTNNAVTTPESSVTTNTILLDEHRDGNIAKVLSVNATQPGYIAIYRVNSLGTVLLIGSSDLLTAGLHENVNVQLNTPLVSGETIVAVLHTDNGDKKFQADGKDPYMTVNGKIITDVDVVAVSKDKEDAKLEQSVQTYLSNNKATSTTP